MSDSLRLKLRIAENRVKFISLPQKTVESLQRCVKNLIKDLDQHASIVLQEGQSWFSLDSDADVSCLKSDEALTIAPSSTTIKTIPLHEHRQQEAASSMDACLQVEIQKLDRPRVKYPQYDEIKTYKISELLTMTQDQRKEFMETLRRHGYIYLELESDQLEQVHKCAKESGEFFQDPVEYKSQFTIEGNRRTWGYKWLPSLRKEYVKVRFNPEILSN
jgi:hypothetical protein